MRPLSAVELLGTWERAVGQAAVERALTLLAAACPDKSHDALATLSIGRRDAMLLTLREQIFGTRLACLTTCPKCSERLEMTFDVSDIRVAEDCERGRSFRVTTGEYEVECRLPNSLDLSALPGSEIKNRTNGQQLLERCLLSVRQSGREIACGALPESVIRTVEDRIAGADAQADVQVDLRCPVCREQWLAAFDIASFSWAEIDGWARRLLRDVHTLASAYGWSEGKILALSPWRRQYYLEMLRG